MALSGGAGAGSRGWRPALEYLCPAVPAQLCGMSDTPSTVLVSGSQSARHHGPLAKIVPILVWLGLLYLLPAAFFVTRSGLEFPLVNVG